MRHTLDCQQCGSRFVDRRPHAKFCSTACYGLSKRSLPDQSCERCGVTFRNKNASRFCSAACYEADRSGSARRPNRTCGSCGTVFYSSHAARYCSRSCFGRASRSRPEGVCRHCGKTFFRAQVGDPIYCGRACYAAARKVVSACEECGKSMPRRRSTSRYCSTPCRDAGNTRLDPKTCLRCGISFRPRRTEALFCGVKCYGLSQRGVGRRAGATFSIRHKRLIVARDGRACRNCGATSGLDFDHITPVCRGGTNDPANGQLLCEPCHADKTNRDLGRGRYRVATPA